LNKGVFVVSVVGLAVGTLIAVYGWFHYCVVVQGPSELSSCVHSVNWDVIFGSLIVIISAIVLIQSFLKPKTTGSETPEENTT
jgi:hypothetical protein